MDDAIIRVLRKYKKIDKKDDITANTKLFSELSITSFDFLVIICEVEKEFAIEIPINDEMQIITIGDLSKYIGQYAQIADD